MGEIRIFKNSTAEHIKSQLKSFDFFSEIELSHVPEKPDVVILHEVKLGERLRRLFTHDREFRARRHEDSKRALDAIANEHPGLKQLLGKKIISKPFTIFKRPVNGAGSHRSPVSHATVSEAKTANIKADCKISWRMGPQNGGVTVTPSSSGKKDDYSAITGTLTDHPSLEDVQAMYAQTLKSASGHVVISPIADQPIESRIIREQTKISAQVGHTDGKAVTSDDASNKVNIPKAIGYRSCTDENIQLLVAAIDAAVRSDPELRVTIATGDFRDSDLSQRIKNQQKNHAAKQMASDTTRMNASSAAPKASAQPPSPVASGYAPKGNKQAPHAPGLHFVSHSALDLHAERWIVPASSAVKLDAQSIGLANLAGSTPSAVASLITVDDLDESAESVQVAGSVVKLAYIAEIKKQWADALASVSGRVVIHPPYQDHEALLGLITVAQEACTKNPALSVSFAVKDKHAQQRLDKAYTEAMRMMESKASPDDDDSLDISDDDSALDAAMLEEVHWKSL